MNESRADSQSFMLVSWAKSPGNRANRLQENRAWAHPLNPKLPYPLLANHQSFHHVRNLYVNLPPLDDLLGVDMFMKKQSYAFFNGISAWIRKCSHGGYCLDNQESERMKIVQQFKDPIDEIGKLLQSLGRIDRLHLVFQVEAASGISFVEYLLNEILKVRNVGLAEVSFAPCLLLANCRNLWGSFDHPLFQRWQDLLQGIPDEREEVQFPSEMDGMYRLLQAIQMHQELDPSSMPEWLPRMLP